MAVTVTNMSRGSRVLGGPGRRAGVGVGGALIDATTREGNRKAQKAATDATKLRVKIGEQAMRDAAEKKAAAAKYAAEGKAAYQPLDPSKPVSGKYPNIKFTVEGGGPIASVTAPSTKGGTAAPGGAPGAGKVGVTSPAAAAEARPVGRSPGVDGMTSTVTMREALMHNTPTASGPGTPGMYAPGVQVAPSLRAGSPLTTAVGGFYDNLPAPATQVGAPAAATQVGAPAAANPYALTPSDLQAMPQSAAVPPVTLGPQQDLKTLRSLKSAAEAKGTGSAASKAYDDKLDEIVAAYGGYKNFYGAMKAEGVPPKDWPKPAGGPEPVKTSKSGVSTAATLASAESEITSATTVLGGDLEVVDSKTEVAETAKKTGLQPGDLSAAFVGEPRLAQSVLDKTIASRRATRAAAEYYAAVGDVSSAMKAYNVLSGIDADLMFAEGMVMISEMHSNQNFGPYQQFLQENDPDAVVEVKPYSDGTIDVYRDGVLTEEAIPMEQAVTRMRLAYDTAYAQMQAQIVAKNAEHAREVQIVSLEATLKAAAAERLAEVRAALVEQGHKPMGTAPNGELVVRVGGRLFVADVQEGDDDSLQAVLRPFDGSAAGYTPFPDEEADDE